jgi:ECF sigma factor
MSTTSDDDLAGLLRRTQVADTDAEQQFVALLYQDLQAIAARRMRREPPEYTWQRTSPVKEAFLHLRAEGALAAAPDRTFS